MLIIISEFGEYMSIDHMSLPSNKILAKVSTYGTWVMANNIMQVTSWLEWAVPIETLAGAWFNGHDHSSVQSNHLKLDLRKQYSVPLEGRGLDS